MAEAQKICRICRRPSGEYPMGEKNGYRLAACTSCGSVAADPWPTQEELDRFFGDIQPEAVHLPNPQAEIAHVKKLLGAMTAGSPPSEKRFLDVSCRQGYAAAAARALGFRQVKGIDPHDFYIAFAKDKYSPQDFERISLQDYAARGEQADVIYSVESFCEQTDPDGYMAALARVLAPGGALYLQEPDGNHFRLPRKFPRWPFVDPPLNFCYISTKGMEILLKRHGLKIRKRFFAWAPFMRLIVTK